MSSYKDRGDGCTDIILDLIAEHESAGSYNAVIGDAHSSEDLSRYSLDQIYGLMDRLLAEGQPSTAVGRYQIIRKTLRGLQASKNLTGTERFTPALQDSLALSLMIGRGYSKWWKGQIDDAEFASGLSCEWASLPDPERGGRSHYDGDGINSAGTSLAHVYDALSRARAAKTPATQADRQTVDQAPSAPAAAGIFGWIKSIFGG